MKVLVKSDSSIKYAFIKCDLEVICTCTSFILSAKIVIECSIVWCCYHFLLYLLHVQFLNASECFASSAHEPSLLDDDKSVCKEPMFRRVFPLKVGLQRSVILLKWDAGCSHCTLLHSIIEYSTITPIANYYRLFHCCSLLHTIEMRCTPCNANRICFITPNILNFWPTFRIAFRTTIKCILDCFTNIKFWIFIFCINLIFNSKNCLPAKRSNALLWSHFWWRWPST